MSIRGCLKSSSRAICHGWTRNIPGEVITAAAVAALPRQFARSSYPGPARPRATRVRARQGAKIAPRHRSMCPAASARARHCGVAGCGHHSRLPKWPRAVLWDYSGQATRCCVQCPRHVNRTGGRGQSRATGDYAGFGNGPCQLVRFVSNQAARAIDDDLRGINTRTKAQCFGIIALALGEGGLCKAVFPAKIIPIGHRKT